MAKKRSLKRNGLQLDYTHRHPKGTRQMVITVRSNATVVVSTPRWYGIKFVEDVLYEKLEWILKQLEKYKESPGYRFMKTDREDYVKNREEARQIIKQKLETINKIYGFTYNKIYIRNQASRWGSCSSEGNLSFNYKIIFLPEDLANYIIAHELCHLKELNHSSRFWNLVSLAVPEYKDLIKKLRHLGTDDLI